MGIHTSGMINRHRTACDNFARVTRMVRPEQWEWPTPCTEWNARELVEHVIGFHEFLLLRPLGVRANRPRADSAARWSATSDALFAALEIEGVLDRATDLPGGGRSAPRSMIPALTTDVLVHTWDLARATGLDPALDPARCAAAYDAARATGLPRDSGMYEPEVRVPAGTDAPTRLIALCGRDPDWLPPGP